ncbi:hypothetical protein [Streptomyces sp. NPDC004284]|uniref:hypothetical protein n=1 Tax=Streptomyces sp. NPDC004284 TaxID=3364695 RepID=UPI00369E97C4
MSLEWDGFRLALGPEGLQFAWAGSGFFEAGVTYCVSTSLRRPEPPAEHHRLVFRFRFPGTAPGGESAVIHVDVPPGAVEQAERFQNLLWQEYSVMVEPDTETEPGAEVEPGAEAEPEGDTEAAAEAEETPDTDADAGAAQEEASAPAELGRIPDTHAWIISPAQERSEELFQDVMARLANSDH